MLEYSCFTTLCYFLLYGKVNQLYIYIYPFFFRFLSHLGHHRIMNTVSCAIQQIFISYLFYIYLYIYVKGYPGDSDCKDSACNVENLGSIPGSGRCPGEGNDYPLQYSCLENSTERAWWATFHGVTKSWIHLSN